MRALVYHGPGQRSWDTVPDPGIIDPTDIIVRIDTSTICGSDLHILKGDVPETTPGTVLGHEAVGTVEITGAAVTSVEVGDRVLMSCISACGRCRFCKEARYGQCLGGGGWIFGHLIDGLQAEYARVPFADNSVYKVPDTLTDEQVLFLADILPTAYEVGVLNGAVRPGDVVAIVGSGPVGLAAVLTAQLYTPGRIIAIDLADTRLERARQFGADTTINNAREDAHARVMELTDGLGADVAIEAVGVSSTFELAAELIRPGGHVANVGVHGHPGHPAPRDDVDQGHHDHDRTGRHAHDPPADEAGGRRPPGSDGVRHPPLRARRHDGRLRHLHRRGLHRRPQGRAASGRRGVRGRPPRRRRVTA